MYIKQTLDSYMASSSHMNMESWMPHGFCWLWDWRIVLIHSLSDLLTFVAYMMIPAITLYVYKYGKLESLVSAFPGLWKLGASFVFFCGLSHLGSFLEVWIGGSLYIVTGINKTVMAVSSVWFAYKLWEVRDEIAIVGRIIQKVKATHRDINAIIDVE